MQGSTGIIDYSGNGRTLLVTGTPVMESDTSVCLVPVTYTCPAGTVDDGNQQYLFVYLD
jgi:hypothetical protein